MTVRQLIRALSDFDPGTTVALDGDCLLVGKGFTLPLPPARKRPKRDETFILEPVPTPEPGLFAEAASEEKVPTDGDA